MILGITSSVGHVARGCNGSSTQLAPFLNVTKYNAQYELHGTYLETAPLLFWNSNCITIMLSVSAAGGIGPVFFVFKGIQMPWRKLDINGRHIVEKL